MKNKRYKHSEAERTQRFTCVLRGLCKNGLQCGDDVVLAVVTPVRPLAVQQRYSQEVQVRAATLVVGLHVLHLPNDDVQQDLREDARVHNTETAHATVR